MRKIIIEIICISFILLFVYTAVSKFIDYDNFRGIIGQSPLITKFATPLSFIVPIGEIVIALMLAIPRYRLKGLYASFAAMVLFTTYIIVLVTLSEKVPCSCGGVIQRMSWTQHLYFNIFFVLVALVGIVLQTKAEGNTPNGPRFANA